MASLAQQFGGLKCSPFPSAKTNKFFSNSKNHHYSRKRSVISAAAVAITNAQTRERMKLKEMFEDAYERCRTAPMEGVSFTVDDFNTALDKYDFNSEIGTKVLIFFFFFFWGIFFSLAVIPLYLGTSLWILCFCLHWSFGYIQLLWQLCVCVWIGTEM